MAQPPERDKGSERKHDAGVAANVDGSPDANGDDGADERPPILGSWKTLYWLLIAALVAQIGLYALLTQAYS